MIQTRQLRLKRSTGSLAIALLFCITTACEITDRTISDRFTKNRAPFDRMIELGLPNNLSCYEASGNVAQCSDPSASKTFEELRKNAGVNSIRRIEGSPELGDAICFTMASYGVLVTDSYSKGIVYSTQDLQPLVDDTSDHAELRFRFHRITDHWFVFAMP